MAAKAVVCRRRFACGCRREFKANRCSGEIGKPKRDAPENDDIGGHGQILSLVLAKSGRTAARNIDPDQAYRPRRHLTLVKAIALRQLRGFPRPRRFARLGATSA